MNKIKICIVAGARPNFIKIAPIIDAIRNDSSKNITYKLIHTGQHYDKKMSNSFFEELGIPDPDSNLNCGGGSQAEQTAKIMVAFEKELITNPVDLVLVVGDVNSTMACAIVAKKLMIKVAHVEAGIRSNDITMPEEINRIITDSITDYFFTTSVEAGENLQVMGIKNENIFFVGNTMIDTLNKFKLKFKKPEIWDFLNLKSQNYFVLTLHRPSNVDENISLNKTLEVIAKNSKNLPVIFPTHPRTKKIISNYKIKFENLIMIDPLSYLEFNYLVNKSKMVITDSGGITEETTVLGIPCLTLRDNTERPETINIGTNELAGTDPENIKKYLKILFSGNWKKGKIPFLWDGKTAERIINIIKQINI